MERREKERKQECKRDREECRKADTELDGEEA